ncbi:hypothetical protein RB628_17535 [Streptomyces sp. ADMS]|uniref:hypothetical protein n=1 Tax=Streptomyces sp. ADMS TaxID=3071415 RepID=UPI00296F5A58|nr:hypothetical protein [Streptomyces sp. ADMS]MDW4907102.1 hypothetical protein [Streptomyces sp. ADMS]
MVDRLVDLSEGFAGSGIESTPNDAGEEAFRTVGADRLRPSFLLGTFAITVPLSRLNPEGIEGVEKMEEIRARGRERAVPAGRTSGPLGDHGGGGRGGAEAEDCLHRRVISPDLSGSLRISLELSGPCCPMTQQCPPYFRLWSSA